MIAWARASDRIAKKFVYVLPDGSAVVNNTRLSKAYYDRASPVMIEQFMKASVRLAYLLDKAAMGQVQQGDFSDVKKI